jgi:capsule polysaccharide modification protein KpsS
LCERRIEAVFLFGDCRPIHRPVARMAEELGMAVWVLEEGYLRPNYVTIERHGVNGNSRLPKDPDFYRRAVNDLPELADPVPLAATFWHIARWTILNAVACTFLWFLYPRYRHHRNVHAFRQSFCWVRGLVRKARWALGERRVLQRLAHERSGQYFLVPLQVYCDAQLQHSRFGSLEAFVDEVVGAFARLASKDTLLVVKQHPHDRPYQDHRRTVAEIGRRHGCADRLVYVHDLHLPTLLKHARGVVTINSTVGISALYHGTPVKVLGKAVYDIAGLTCQRPLGEFLRAPGRVDTRLFGCFVRWLREDNQVNGSLYHRVPALGTACGIDASALARPEPSPSGRAAPERPASDLGAGYSRNPTDPQEARVPRIAALRDESRKL